MKKLNMNTFAKEIKEELEGAVELTNKEAMAVVSAVKKIIKRGLVSEGGVSIPGLGRFVVGEHEYNSRLGGVHYNGKTKVVRFKASEDLKRFVNEA